MKKTAIALTLALFVSLLGGCQTSDGGAFSANDMALAINGEEYTISMNIENVISSLGNDFAYSEAISCDYDGLDKIYTFPDAELYTYPLSGGDLINEIYTQSTAAETTKGIAVGSTKAEVLAAYGDGGEDTGSFLVYRRPATDEKPNGESLCFEFDGDVVQAIILTTQPV